MTLYSKWFDTHNEYEAYKNGQSYILPNVSICFNDLNVHYDPYKDPRFIATFNITDVSSPSIIAGKAPWLPNVWFTDVEIDGEIISNEDIIIDNTYIKYQFNNTGKHTVKFSFNNQEMTTMDSFTFYSVPSDNISEMDSLIIPFGITSVGGLDNFHSLTSVTIPNSVTALSGFVYCTSLASITIPNSVTTLSGFGYCTSLASITIPNSVTTIGNNTFNNCTGLTSVTISNSVTTIGDNSFSFCTSLVSVTIPNSVTTIGDGVLCDCTNLTAITILCETPPNVQSSSFGRTTPNCPIYVPANSVDLYKSTWTSFADRIQAIP